MKKIFRGISSVYKFLIGIFLSLFLYDKKYLKSKWFKSKRHGIGAIGWNWVLVDAKSRIFLGKNRGIRFPVSPNVTISNPQNLTFHIDCLNIFQGFGNYYQMFPDTKIFIGKGTWIAPNVGIITTNHDVKDLDKHIKGKDVIIGENCWIGMNSVILPGVHLGNNTIVGAGSIVTKSFENGNCVIAGNPARIIKAIY